MIAGIIFYILCALGMWVHIGTIEEMMYKYEERELQPWISVGACVLWPLALVTSGISYIIIIIGKE